MFNRVARSQYELAPTAFGRAYTVVKVMIIDDHPVVRWGFRQIVNELAPDIEIVADAANGPEALLELDRQSADVAVLDIGLGGRSGLELLERLRGHRSEVRVLFYTRYSEHDFALRAFQGGAKGYISKEESPAEIVRAVREVAAGGTYMSRTAAQILTSAVSNQRGEGEHENLSRREFEVFRMLVDGLSVTSIAQRLHLSVKTISTRRSNVLAKLGVRSTADLVRYAIGRGLSS
ncbi:MAG: response regulator transcription factor [Proteobacteria bacterium]|nr:response regulator transcription factor [Pseudomonadota bacterium]